MATSLLARLPLFRKKQTPRSKEATAGATTALSLGWQTLKGPAIALTVIMLLTLLALRLLSAPSDIAERQTAELRAFEVALTPLLSVVERAALGDGAAAQRLQTLLAEQRARLDELQRLGAALQDEPGFVIWNAIGSDRQADVEAQVRKLLNSWQKAETWGRQILSTKEVNQSFEQRLTLVRQAADAITALATTVAPQIEERPLARRTFFIALLTQRISQRSAAYLADPNDETLAALRSDIAALERLAADPLPEAITPFLRGRLGEVLEAAQLVVATMQEALQLAPQWIGGKRAAIEMLAQVPQLQEQTAQLYRLIEQELETARSGTNLVLMLAGIALVGVFVQTAKTYVDFQQAQAAREQAERAKAEENNRRTQDAILRLLNEMADLADGDLTIRATVTEDITGAIADSVNYAIEELSTLVKRINQTAEQIAAATQEAQTRSAALLADTEKQAVEIEEADAITQDVAKSLGESAQAANQSAQAARRSLEASMKGTQAVGQTVEGMNRIREQIQETAKRIKRLGESSQEIGEIVELISDITEQTNVLALNAAIQAAAAGEAGRGFTVVAEEVQRLAERSAEATKQIAALVRTIQTDTQDTIAAMEATTQEVVAGTALSADARAALDEIAQTSRETAALIARVTQDIQAQAARGEQISRLMRDVLAITQRTREGTQDTAALIASLADLAAELRGSVAGFRV